MGKGIPSKATVCSEKHRYINEHGGPGSSVGQIGTLFPKQWDP